MQPQQSLNPNSVDFLVVSTAVERHLCETNAHKIGNVSQKRTENNKKTHQETIPQTGNVSSLGLFFWVWIKLGLVTRCHPQSFGLGRSATPRRRLKTELVLKMKPAKPKPVRKETMKILMRRFDQKDSTLNQSVKVLKTTGHSQTQWSKQKVQRNHRFMVANWFCYVLLTGWYK